MDTYVSICIWELGAWELKRPLPLYVNKFHCCCCQGGHKPLILSFAKSPLVFSWILICIPLTPSFCPFHSAVSKKYSAQWLRLDTLTYSRPLVWYHYGHNFQISSRNIGSFFHLRFYRPKLVIQCFGKGLKYCLDKGCLCSQIRFSMILIHKNWVIIFGWYFEILARVGMKQVFCCCQGHGPLYAMSVAS